MARKRSRSCAQRPGPMLWDQTAGGFGLLIHLSAGKGIPIITCSAPDPNRPTRGERHRAGQATSPPPHRIFNRNIHLTLIGKSAYTRPRYTDTLWSVDGVPPATPVLRGRGWHGPPGAHPVCPGQRR
jgi:hypothetical protein